MNAPAHLSDLKTLSIEQKDEFIHSLWARVAAEQVRSQTLQARVADLERQLAGEGAAHRRQLLAELRKAGPTRRIHAPLRVAVRLGRGFDFLRSKAVLGALVVVALAFTADYGVAWYQQRTIQQKRLAELRLQRAAFTTLNVELVRVVYEPDDKSYRLTMVMQNVNPESPVYVMLNPVRAFVQSGISWREIPSRAPDGVSWGVVKLADTYTYQTIFEPNVEDWAELIPGYMHVRFENDMLISQRSEPTDDIVERKDPYYVYLKPHGADDEAIRKRSKYAGVPPVYIPMPPH